MNDRVQSRKRNHRDAIQSTIARCAGDRDGNDETRTRATEGSTPGH
jgi:hypothetical protein